jgi:hypothetical protein
MKDNFRLKPISSEDINRDVSNQKRALLGSTRTHTQLYIRASSHMQEVNQFLKPEFYLKSTKTTENGKTVLRKIATNSCESNSKISFEKTRNGKRAVSRSLIGSH